MSQYNEALRGMTTASTPEMDQVNQDASGYTVGMADLSTLNIAPHFRGSSVVYLGTENHPCLQPVDPRYQFDRLDLDRLINAVIAREWSRDERDPHRGVLLMGPRGTGKSTYLAQRFARQGIPLAVFTWKPAMEACDLLYSRSLIGGDVVVEKGAAWLAMEGGYPLLIEEGDLARPGELASLNDVIDSGTFTVAETGERVVARRGFFVCMTCNSSFTEDRDGGYAGTRAQNASTLERFFKFEMKAPTAAEHTAFVKHMLPSLPDDRAAQYGSFMALMDKATEADGDGVQVKGATKHLSLGFSRRALIDWLGLTDMFAGLETQHICVPKYALGPVYTSGLPEDEKATVEHLFDLAFGIAKADP